MRHLYPDYKEEINIQCSRDELERLLTQKIETTQLDNDKYLRGSLDLKSLKFTCILQMYTRNPHYAIVHGVATSFNPIKMEVWYAINKYSYLFTFVPPLIIFALVIIRSGNVFFAIGVTLIVLIFLFIMSRVYYYMSYRLIRKQLSLY